jgi:peptidylprolyl isomerase domain and WD repeat-containing protein 1
MSPNGQQFATFSFPDRKVGPEREIDNETIRKRVNVIFDESGHFILYGSILGTKVVNTLTNKVVKLYGKDEPFRALHLTMYQGAPDKKGVVTVAMAASDNPLLQEAEARDAMLVATGSGKVRFYMFTNEDPYVSKPYSLVSRLTFITELASQTEMFIMKSLEI